MKLSAVPDSTEPGGGFGYLVLDGTDLSEPSVSVQVLDTYSERWLGKNGDNDEPVTIGDGLWQTEPHAFGPYSAERKGSEIWIRIGPEIVNKIEEYTPLRITIADKTMDLVWPDDVLPRIAPALTGEIHSSSAKPLETETQRAIVIIEPEDLEPPSNEIETKQSGTEETRQSRWLLWFLFLVVAAVAATAFFLWPSTDPTESTGIAYEPDSDASAANPCSYTTIDQAGGGFPAVEKAFHDCGSEISPSDALRLLENGVQASSPEALLLFGKLYDVQQKDDLIETTVGLTFGDDPATAAEYYHRAKTAGSPEAETLLILTCGRLSKVSSTLARGALDDYCPNQ